MRFDLNNYVDCQERINRFWSEHPNGSIVTELLSSGDNFEQVVIKASVYKTRNLDCGPVPDATGIAAEMKGTGGANNTSWHENAETSAIGRALANMGYATSRDDRPSRQEMEKVNRGNAPVASPDGAGATFPGRSKSTTVNTVTDEAEAYPSGVTKKQVRMIGRTAEEKGVTPEQVKAMHGKESATLLTRPEASELIEKLLALPTEEQQSFGSERAEAYRQ